MKPRKYTCPRCKAKEGVDIIYDMPSPELLEMDASTSKSQKTRLHFACKEKMFTVDHEVFFSEFDAKGKVLTASNFGRQEQYQWLPLTDVYSKLLSYAC